MADGIRLDPDNGAISRRSTRQHAIRMTAERQVALSPGHFDHDLAARMTALYRPQRLAGLLKRERRRDERVQLAVHDELGHRVEHGPVPGARDRRAAQLRDRVAVTGRYQLGPVRQQPATASRSAPPPGRKSRRRHPGRRPGPGPPHPGPGST